MGLEVEGVCGGSITLFNGRMGSFAKLLGVHSGDLAARRREQSVVTRVLWAIEEI